MCSGQRAAAAQACLQHPFADRHDQADFLGERDELVGRDQPALGMVPAQQRLEAGDLAGLQVDERLVVELELAAWRARLRRSSSSSRRACMRASISGSKKR